MAVISEMQASDSGLPRMAKRWGGDSTKFAYPVSQVNTLIQSRRRANMQRKPFQMDEKTHELLKRYSDLTGVPMSRVVRDIVTDWMDTVGAARIESLTHQPISSLKAQYYTNVAEHAEHASDFEASVANYNERLEEQRDLNDQILDAVVPLRKLN